MRAITLGPSGTYSHRAAGAVAELGLTIEMGTTLEDVATTIHTLNR